MVKYHPDAHFLTDYAAGSLPPSQALCVATHLHFCTGCRQRVGELTELGAELFVQQRRVVTRPKAALVSADAAANNPAATGDPKDQIAFEHLLARITVRSPTTPTKLPAANDRSISTLPRTLHRLAGPNLEKAKWYRVGRKFRYASLNVGDSKRETSLLDIKAGYSIPHHRHRGDEITVILKGSFSDREGKYNVGDFVMRTHGESHSPVASQDQDCLCLATVDAPIVMTSWFNRLGMLIFNRWAVPAANLRRDW